MILDGKVAQLGAQLGQHTWPAQNRSGGRTFRLRMGPDNHYTALLGALIACMQQTC
jgi:hypothetical protein